VNDDVAAAGWSECDNITAPEMGIPALREVQYVGRLQNRLHAPAFVGEYLWKRVPHVTGFLTTMVSTVIVITKPISKFRQENVFPDDR